MTRGYTTLEQDIQQSAAGIAVWKSIGRVFVWCAVLWALVLWFQDDNLSSAMIQECVTACGDRGLQEVTADRCLCLNAEKPVEH